MLIVALTIFAGAQMLVPSKSEAGMRCNTDIFGNTRCTGTGNDSGWNSNTSTDIFGNDNTTYRNNNTGQSGTLRCSKDIFGNYVCN